MPRPDQTRWTSSVCLCAKLQSGLHAWLTPLAPRTPALPPGATRTRRYRTKTQYETQDEECEATSAESSTYSLIAAAGGACTSRDVEPCNGGDPVVAVYADHTDDSVVPKFPYPSCDESGSPTECIGFRPCPTECVWKAWSSWSGCSAPCGQNGVQYRTREVAVEPLPAMYYAAGAQSVEDSTACELNTLNDTYAPTGKTDGYPCGLPCTGDNIQWRSCFRKECPVDCVWSEWSGRSSCSKLCGGGTQMRSRYVKEQPQHGGALCTPGPCDDSGDGSAMCGATHTRVCNPASCEYARIHDKQDDKSKDQDLCQFKEEGSMHCPTNLTLTGGNLTALGGDPRPNDIVKSNCIESGDCDIADIDANYESYGYQ